MYRSIFTIERSENMQNIGNVDYIKLIAGNGTLCMKMLIIKILHFLKKDTKHLVYYLIYMAMRVALSPFLTCCNCSPHFARFFDQAENRKLNS